MSAPVHHDGSLLDQYLSSAQLIHAGLLDELPRRAPAQAGVPIEGKVWLIGTGTPKILPNRAGPSTFLEMGTDKVLVDCGTGATERLLRLGVDIADLTHIVITHHHLDHNAELAWLVLSPWVDRTRQGCPLIIGPPGTMAFVDRLLAAFDYDARTREPFGITPDSLRPRIFEVKDGTMFGGDGWGATAFRVDHQPVDQAFGYRFDWDRRSLAISGDTTPCQNLVAHCKGVDVLIHEALYPGFGFARYHTSVEQVGKVAASVEAGELVLTHLIPGHLPDELWHTAVARDFDRRIRVGHDLMRVV